MRGNAQRNGCPLSGSELWSYFSSFVVQSTPGCNLSVREIPIYECFEDICNKVEKSRNFNLQFSCSKNLRARTPNFGNEVLYAYQETSVRKCWCDSPADSNDACQNTLNFFSNFRFLICKKIAGEDPSRRNALADTYEIFRWHRPCHPKYEHPRVDFV